MTSAASGNGAAIAKQIKASGGRAVTRKTDTSIAADVEGLVTFAAAQTGGLHPLVNNAGIGGPAQPLGEYPLDGWQKVIGVNVTGAYHRMRYGLPEVVKAGGGATVNMASVLGSIGFATACAYVAAKHGVVGLTKVAALEYAKAGVQVNAVGPGFIATPLLEKHLDAAARDDIAALHPVVGLARPHGCQR